MTAALLRGGRRTPGDWGLGGLWLRTRPDHRPPRIHGGGVLPRRKLVPMGTAEGSLAPAGRGDDGLPEFGAHLHGDGHGVAGEADARQRMRR